MDCNFNGQYWTKPQQGAEIPMRDYDFIKENSLINQLANWFGKEVFCPKMDKLRPLFEQINKDIKRRGIKIVTIGGTNGKGETAHSLAALIKNRGFKVAMFTSPHVLSIRERFFYDGQLAGYDQLERIFEKARPLMKDFSFYEFLFFSFCKFVLEKDVDILILEVGLGGRLDAVNLLEPDLTCITSISRDHESILGRGYQKILLEKLGITRKGILLLTSLELKFCRKQVEKFCKLMEIPFFDLHENEIVTKDTEYYLQNRIMAFSLANYLIGDRELVDKDYLRKVKEFSFPVIRGRFEKVTLCRRSFTFIGAHNLDGFRKMIKTLVKTNGKKMGPNPGFDRVILSFSKRPEEEIFLMISAILSSGISKRVVLTTFEHFKACEVGFAIKSISDDVFEFITDWKSYFDKNVLENENILVTGSYYFIGEVQKHVFTAHHC